MSKVSSKALVAAADTASKAIDLSRDLGSFFVKLLGPGMSALGGAFNDWAGVYRYDNALRLAARVERIHQARSIQAKTVPISQRLGIPLLEAATLESDPTLQEMWASLMANATDPSRHIEARRSFVDLLRALEPLDAQLLIKISQDQEARPKLNSASMLTSDKRNADWVQDQFRSFEQVEIALSIETLGRLGLVHDEFPPLIEGMGPVAPVPLTHPEAMIALTYTGYAFLKACQPEIIENKKPKSKKNASKTERRTRSRRKSAPQT